MKYENGVLSDLQLEPREIEQQWERFLTFMVLAHREKFPGDSISTPELCEVFMQRILKKGLIEQDEDGVYQLPPIIASN